ncbi:unnamed protein product [Adineta steineri]|uniref:Uncharacterized protein n=1 Tax=Adineta steineri TaxID=433720 RepID=A0A820S9B8_9BILA|nr:unnamed protein product [Adineta steineri]
MNIEVLIRFFQPEHVSKYIVIYFFFKENPVSGGKSGSTIFGYNEVIMTGHADGSVKFWDASGCNLLFLYKLRTNRLFDRIQPTN